MLDVLVLMTFICAQILSLIIKCHLLDEARIYGLLFLMHSSLLILLIELLVNSTLLTVSLTVNNLLLSHKFVGYRLKVPHIAIILLLNLLVLVLEIWSRIVFHAT